MPTLRKIEEEITKLPEGPAQVVVLAGGTTGIGSYIAEALAKVYRDTGSKLRVYIVGRNAERARSVISNSQKICAGSEWRFIAVKDLALMSEVDLACKEIVTQETANPFCSTTVRIDLLYMTYSYPVLGERSVTKEGLDALLSTLYYTRVRFIMQLLPLLTASPVQGHAITVYSGGVEDSARADNRLVGCPPDDSYGVSSVRRHASFMKTFLFEELCRRHTGRLRISHIYPGLVDGPVFYSADLPTWFRISWRVSKPLLSLYMTRPEDCGKCMVYLATPHFPARGVAATSAGLANSTDGELGGGCYAVGQRCDTKKRGSLYARVDRPATRDLVWRHTMDVLGLES